MPGSQTCQTTRHGASNLASEWADGESEEKRRKRKKRGHGRSPAASEVALVVGWGSSGVAAECLGTVRRRSRDGKKKKKERRKEKAKDGAVFDVQSMSRLPPHLLPTAPAVSRLGTGPLWCSSRSSVVLEEGFGGLMK